MLKLPNMTDADWDALEFVSTGDSTIPADPQSLDRLREFGFLEQANGTWMLTHSGRAKFASKYVP